MTEPAKPQTPVEAVLRILDAKQCRRHQWIALFSSVVVSVQTREGCVP
jgi:hypothetical protein